MKARFLKPILLAAGLFMSSPLLAKAELIASGTVSLNGELQSKAKGIRTLYLVVYDEESPRPMPFGAQKVDLEKDASGQFYTFNITTDSIARMNPHAEVPKKLKIKARLDKDGSAGMDQSGDIIGVVAKITRGSQNLKIVLDEAK